MIGTVCIGAKEHGHIDELPPLEEVVWQVLEKDTVDTGSPVEQWHWWLGTSREGLSKIGGLERSSLLATQTSHLLRASKAVAPCLTDHSFELILELRDKWLCREEDGLDHCTDKQLVIATAMGNHVHGN